MIAVLRALAPESLSAEPGQKHVKHNNLVIGRQTPRRVQSSDQGLQLFLILWMFFVDNPTPTHRTATARIRQVFAMLHCDPKPKPCKSGPHRDHERGPRLWLEQQTNKKQPQQQKQECDRHTGNRADVNFPRKSQGVLACGPSVVSGATTTANVTTDST